jgi:hypothetical protein
MVFPGRKTEFFLGVAAALWPIGVVAFVPSEYLNAAGADLNTSDRLPLAILCVAALISEAIAMFLFFGSRRRLKDQLTSWSVIGAAAAGLCTLAFLAAAIANAMKIW